MSFQNVKNHHDDDTFIHNQDDDDDNNVDDEQPFFSLSPPFQQQQQQQQQQQEKKKGNENEENTAVPCNNNANDNDGTSIQLLYQPKDLISQQQQHDVFLCSNPVVTEKEEEEHEEEDDASSSSSSSLHSNDDYNGIIFKHAPPPILQKLFTRIDSINNNDKKRKEVLKQHLLHFILNNNNDGSDEANPWRRRMEEEEEDTIAQEKFNVRTKDKTNDEKGVDYKEEEEEEEIATYRINKSMQGNHNNNNNNNNNNTHPKKMMELYKTRRNELRDLATKIRWGDVLLLDNDDGDDGGGGGARIDQDGRLIPILPPRQQQEEVEVPVQNNDDNDNDNDEEEDNPFNPNNNLNNNNNAQIQQNNNFLLDLLHPIHNDDNDDDDEDEEQIQEEQIRRIMQEEEEVACNEILGILDRYSDLGIELQQVQREEEGQEEEEEETEVQEQEQEEEEEEILQFVRIDNHRLDGLRLNNGTIFGGDGNENANNNNIPHRQILHRIGFILFALASIFIGVLFQSPPPTIMMKKKMRYHSINYYGMTTTTTTTTTTTRAKEAIYDPLLYEIMETRDFVSQIVHCFKDNEDDGNGGGADSDMLRRREGTNDIGLGLWDWFFRSWWQKQDIQGRSNKHNHDVYHKQEQNINCADGVLHIPSTTVLNHTLSYLSRRQEHDSFPSSLANETAAKISLTIEEQQQQHHHHVYKRFMNGVNLKWFFPCIIPSNIENPTSLLKCYTTHENADKNNGKTINLNNNNNNNNNHKQKDNKFCKRDGKNQKKKRHFPFIPSFKKKARHHQSIPPLPVPQQQKQQCFRGVHDNLIKQSDVDSILHLASDLIVNNGGDHVEIHFLNSTENDNNMNDNQKDIASKFQTFITPTILSKLSNLLQVEYGLSKHAFVPVAFRINAALPIMDSSNNMQHHVSPAETTTTTHSLVGVVNRTTHEQWEMENHKNNDRSRFATAHSSLPLYSFLDLQRTFRDPCILMSDLEAHSSFAILTSISLSSGAGEDFSGGTSLFINGNHQSNSKPQKKLKRGLSIDGSVGRVVVSTGGDENRRCRMPMRSGVRAVLQIWWGCT